jgi:hypothetical protein
MLKTPAAPAANSMAPTVSRSSRRALLAASLGALGTTITQAVARPLNAAATPDPVLLGVSNGAAATTGVVTSVGSGLKGFSTDDHGAGVLGVSGGAGPGVKAQGMNGPAFAGTSNGGPGLDVSSSTHAVKAVSSGSNSAGVIGISTGPQTGVIGYADYVGNPIPGRHQTGVFGLAILADDPKARGVWGETTFGRGVNGVATAGTGVYGTATGGEGVHGESTDSNGVSGSTSSGIASGVLGLNSSTG